MKQLFVQQLDITDYLVARNIEKVASVINEVDSVSKDTDIPTFDGEAEHKPNDFALIMEHPKAGVSYKYACYNADLTKLNMQCLIDKMITLPEELVKIAATNLTCAANNFHIEIPEELKKYASTKYVSRKLSVNKINEVKYMKKIAMDNSKNNEVNFEKFALNGKYPIDTPEQIEKAAAWFDRNFTKLPIEDQVEFISNLREQVNQVGGNLEKTAAADFTYLNTNVFNEDFYTHIQVRKSYLSGENQEGLENYNDLLGRADEFGPIKTAMVLEILDKEENLDHLYGKNIIDPLRSCCALIKEASVEYNGRVITASDLKGAASNADLTAIVGNDVMTEFKGADGLAVFSSLPTPVKNEVVNLL